MQRRMSEDETYELQMIQDEDGGDINYLKTEYKDLKDLVEQSRLYVERGMQSYESTRKQIRKDLAFAVEGSTLHLIKLIQKLINNRRRTAVQKTREWAGGQEL